MNKSTYERELAIHGKVISTKTVKTEIHIEKDTKNKLKFALKFIIVYIFQDFFKFCLIV